MSVAQPVYETVVIGAGIAGLTIAHYLTTQLQHPVHIVEKSRGVGGRIATRRQITADSTALFDHGAQWYKLRPETQYIHDNVFSKYKLSNLWYKQTKGDKSEAVYSSTNGGMNNLCKHIASDAKLNIDFNTKLVKIELIDNNTLWKLTYDNHATTTCNNLILAIPLPQALDILDASSVQYNSELRKNEYAKALCALLELDDSAPQIGDAGQIENDEDGIHSISDQHAKRTSPVKAWTVVMTPDWSDQHYDNDDNATLDDIIAIVKQKYPSISIKAQQLKKWRYSHSTVKPDKDRMYEVVRDKPLLALVGDAFGGGSIAGSLRSAGAAIQHFQDKHTKSAL